MARRWPRAIRADWLGRAAIVVALGLLVGLAAGCSSADEVTVFRTALPQERDPPLPVVLRDSTGLVAFIGPATDPTGDQVTPRLIQDSTDATAFVVAWLGGPCEGDAALNFESWNQG